MRRALLNPILEDLRRKMVFVSGPRQVGKTTLALQVLERLSPNDRVYLNWDRPEHRRIIRDLAWSRDAPVAVLDEVHKYARWKNLLKGFYDTEGARQRLLVTGSARLDLYRRGGESLVGRYAPFRLHPITYGELVRQGDAPDPNLLLEPGEWGRHGSRLDAEEERALHTLGGFPEPLLAGSERSARRWRLARREQILRQDLRDLTMVREVTLVEQLVDLLTERVGSPLSINALREDLEVDHKTVSRWIDVLERLFVVFRLRPYAKSLARAIRKEAKLYFWDWSEVPNPAARFENLVASHLLKYAHWMQDVEGHRVELRYLRDREKREVDFLLVRDRKPWVLAETKLAEASPSPALRYFADALGVEHLFQITQSKSPGRDVVPVGFLSGLP
jgi:hypothetical protein